jgi:hypothetical protein
MIILRNSYNTEDILYRYDESISAFESVPDENDSVKLSLYEKKFSERAYQALVKAGHIRNE